MERIHVVREYMSHSTVSLDPGKGMYEAIDELLHRKAPSLPVVDEQKHLLGILTEKDCLRAVSLSAWGEAEMGTVADSMSILPAEITPETDIFSAVRVFVDTYFTCLPVSEEGELVGMVCREHLLRGIRKLQNDMAAAKGQEGRLLHGMQHPESIEEFQRLAASQKKEQLAAVLSNRHREGGAHK